MRLVVKVGTSLIAPGGRIDNVRMRALVDQLDLTRHEYLIVSSGAIAAGMSNLGLAEKPSKVPLMQACAAVGQSILMHTYERLFFGKKLVAQLLKRECGLAADWLIADVAFGTGLFTRLLLENGNSVIGVEPNAEMRQAGETFLANFPLFRSVTGTAESTSLADRSVNLITAAQAAHWFDFPQARREFARILKPGGWCVFIWNERQLDSTPFLRAYENLLKEFGSDYQDVRHELTTARIHEFFAPSSFRDHTFPYRQEFDYAALEGRLLSSSYAPQAGDANHSPMLAELRKIFDSYQEAGKVWFAYNTRVFFGQLD